jgi:hypothetical protein
MLRSHARALKRTAIVVAVVAGAVMGIGPTVLAADGSTNEPASFHPLPAPTSIPQVTTEAPVGNVGDFTQTYIENFDTPAAANGPFAATYANAWQPYADGSGGRYWSGSQISAHDGYMDVTLDGVHGAAGAFGTPTGAWDHVGGKFTIRARAIGGDTNGASVMLWPTSNVWSDGEVNYPEGNFDKNTGLNQHSMQPGLEDTKQSYNTEVSWRDWHTYSIEWIPGKSVKYFLDGVLIQTITENVPTTPHRYMFQVGNWGAPGHFDVDWVTTYDYTPKG